MTPPIERTTAEAIISDDRAADRMAEVSHACVGGCAGRHGAGVEAGAGEDGTYWLTRETKRFLMRIKHIRGL